MRARVDLLPDMVANLKDMKDMFGRKDEQEVAARTAGDIEEILRLRGVMTLNAFREYVKRIKKQYPPGTRLRLVSMDDGQAPPPGAIGLVTNVDDIGTIHVRWASGGSLGLIEGKDIFSIVEEKEEGTP